MTEATKQQQSHQRKIDTPDIVRIRQDYQKALAYQQSDPAACLGTSRRVAEDICRQVLRAETTHDPDGLMLHKLIGKLTGENILPSYIVAPLRTIQSFGNLGAHPQGKDADRLTPEFVQPCLDSLYTVVAWYVETYQTPETGGAETITKPARPQESEKMPGGTEEETQTSPTGGTFQQLKRKMLIAQLEDLQKKYEAANAQLTRELGDVEKLTIRNQIVHLEQQIQEIERALNQLSDQ